MLTWKEIQNSTVFVVKMQGWRDTGTWEQIKDLAQDEDCRDCDICAKQPTAELQNFWDTYFSDKEYRVKKPEDFYNDKYNRAEAARW